MKTTRAHFIQLILLIGMVLGGRCESFSQTSQGKTASDTIICLTESEVRALLKLKAERDYLHKQFNVLIKADSLKQATITDNNKSIKALEENLTKSQSNMNEQIHKKEMWRDATFIGIPVSFIGGLILSIFI
jgi:hypothetical protein